MGNKLIYNLGKCFAFYFCLLQHIWYKHLVSVSTALVIWTYTGSNEYFGEAINRKMSWMSSQSSNRKT